MGALERIDGDVQDQAWSLVARSCMYLDENRYDQYLALFHEDCTYTISWHSPELRKDVILLSHAKPGLASLMDNIRFHVVLPGSFFRQASLYTVQAQAAGYEATSYVTVVHTDQYGTSSLFCAARYIDRLVHVDGEMKIASRHVRMQTRDIGPGCHFPV